MKQQVSSCPVGTLLQTPADSFQLCLPAGWLLPLTLAAHLQARSIGEGLQEDRAELPVMVEGCWAEGYRLGKEHCRVAKEEASVLMVGVVQYPDPVLIPIYPPYCSLLIHTLVLLGLSHGQDCPLLFPDRLALIRQYQHLRKNNYITIINVTYDSGHSHRDRFQVLFILLII